MKSLNNKLAIIMIAFQVIMIILFAIFVRFDDMAMPTSKAKSIPGYQYAMFQDVHVMIFIGFGYLMTFLKKYSYSSVSFNLFLASMVIQWSTLVVGFCHHWEAFTVIKVNTTGLIFADVCAAAVLISFGAVLGKASPLQLVVMAFIEVIFYGINETLCFNYLKISDMGGSIVIHTFGAYFGLAVTFALYRPSYVDDKNEGPSYQSDISAMIGTVFLWIFWPSFNAALAKDDQQQRAVFNTYYAIAACTCIAFAWSSLLDSKRRYQMVHIQNSTLAGGVAVGAAANMLMPIWVSMTAGIIAAIVSVIGYNYITPFLARKRIHDTCGVNNLHGMPGLIAAFLSAIIAAIATYKDYKQTLFEIFPARQPSNMTNSTLLLVDQAAGDGRTAGAQAGFQLLGLLMTLGFSIGSGLLTGYLLKLPIFDQVDDDNLFLDEVHWEVPEDVPEKSMEMKEIAVSSPAPDNQPKVTTAPV